MTTDLNQESTDENNQLKICVDNMENLNEITFLSIKENLKNKYAIY